MGVHLKRTVRFRYYIVIKGFCADSFEIGQGIVNSRILQPRLINDINFNIIDVNSDVK